MFAGHRVENCPYAGSKALENQGSLRRLTPLLIFLGTGSVQRTRGAVSR